MAEQAAMWVSWARAQQCTASRRLLIALRLSTLVGVGLVGALQDQVSLVRVGVGEMVRFGLLFG